jgi:hypothetical protein
MDLRTPVAVASPDLRDSAVDCFDLATAFLRSAGTTAVRAAGSFTGGAPWVGGVDEAGGELQGLSLFCSFGSVVNVNPGGFFGMGEGQGILGGEGQQPGSSKVNDVTILSSKGSWTLHLSTASAGRVEGGESPLLPSSPHVIRDRQGHDGPARAPAWLGSGLSLVRLGDETSQVLPKATQRKVKKIFSLPPLDIQEVRDGGPGVI